MKPQPTGQAPSLLRRQEGAELKSILFDLESSGAWSFRSFESFSVWGLRFRILGFTAAEQSFAVSRLRAFNLQRLVFLSCPYALHGPSKAFLNSQNVNPSTQNPGRFRFVSLLHPLSGCLGDLSGGFRFNSEPYKALCRLMKPHRNARRSHPFTMGVCRMKVWSRGLWSSMVFGS